MIDTKQLKQFDGLSGPSFPIDAEMPSTTAASTKGAMLGVLKSKAVRIARNPLFLVIITWTVMAFLLAFEVAAKK